MQAQIEDVDVIEPSEDSEGRIVFHLADGRVLSIPLSWSRRLEEATEEERQNHHIIAGGYGVHWPDVDEDLSATGALRGAPESESEEIDAKQVRREAWPPGRIKRLRNRLGDTQEEFAQRLGVRQGTVSDWETGKHVPRKMTVRFLDQLASANPIHEEFDLWEIRRGHLGRGESEGSPPAEESSSLLEQEVERVRSNIELAKKKPSK